jgi:rhodanese-related sulfurtransferase
MHQFGTFVVNHWELFLALAVTIGMILYTELFSQGHGVKRAGPHAATTLISHEDAMVLDVREDQEYRGGHILNSVHIPLSQLKGRLPELDKHKGRTVIVGCRSGHRSGRASGMLRKHGFERVYNLEGGILAWENANLPLTRKTEKAR